MAIRDVRKNASLGGLNYNAVQLAKIKSTRDTSHSGKMLVWLVNSGTDENNEGNWTAVGYASPFAGASSPDNVDPQATATSGQTSYGFFAVPPDPENFVLVAFINGEPDKGYWFSGIYGDNMTHGMPGRAAGDTPQGNGKPSGEVNRYSQDIKSPDSNPQRPSLADNSAALDEQGVADDPLLGPGTATAFRDDTPTSMGIVSPGGNQLTMDDGGGLVRIRTSSGVQLVLSESTGDIVMINKSGNGWIRLGNGGDIDIYGSNSFNVFSGSDINFSAGGSINLEAPNINIKGSNVAIEGSGINLKAGSINSSFINADVAYSNETGIAAAGGITTPVGDTASGAGSVTRTPSRGGKAS
jgi:hypothetical protein